MKLKHKIQYSLLKDWQSLPSKNKTITSTTLKDDLEFLDQKIDLVTRNISAYDIYNIVDAVTNDMEVQTKITALAPNSALIINANLNNYTKGDIVIKKENGEIEVVAAEGSGFYYPSQINNVSDGTYALRYSFSTHIPSSGSTTGSSVGSEELTSPAFKINYTGLKAAEQEVSYSVVYRRESDEDSFSFEILKDEDEKIIEPVVKCYCGNDIVECVLTIQKKDGNFIVSNVPMLVNKVVVR